MLIQEIHVDGIGPYTNPQTLTLEGNLVGIYGRNGAGKTFLLEATFATLYGNFPSRKGTIYDQINDNLTKGELSIKFSLNGELYQAKRVIDKKSKKQLCTLSKNGSPIAGPKTAEYLNAIRTLLGTEETVLASTFSTDDFTGDLTLLPGSKRKELLAEWLELEHYQTLSDAAKEKARGLESSLAEARARLEILLERAEGTESLREHIRALKGEINTIRKEIESWESEKDKIERKLAALNEKRKTLEQLKQRRETINEELLMLRERYRKLCDDRRKILSIMKEKPYLLKKMAEHKEISELVDQLEQKVNAMLEKREKAQKEKDSLTKKLHEVEKEIARISSKLAAAKRESETIDRVRCNRRDCPFLQSAWAAREVLPSLTKRLKAKEELAEKIREKIASVSVCEIPRGVAIQLASLKKRKQELNEEVLRLTRLEEAEKRLAYFEAEIRATVESGKRKKDELKRTLQQIEEIELELKDHEGGEEVLSVVRLKLDSLRSSLQDKNMSLGDLTRRLEEAEKAREEAEKLREKVERLREDFEDYSFICEMFGKCGIQPLLMEASLPRLEQLTQQFLSSICERQFNVTFKTTKETKSGKIQETLDIVVTDLETGTKRDIANFSGGEKTLIRQAIRMASAVFRSEVHKNRWDTFFCDESFGKLDEVNARQLLSAMKALTNYFKKVVYISHERELIEIASQKVLVENGKIAR
ncbi:chromosome segregation protein SMC [Candidatus Desulfofervidus auxilii]|uniref:Chromosome segregation protein SMC n=1 Tax=Desulfofervidus auxilii TaxID=1621989 RepID=A0A7U4QK00_DESA2|nr:AAA family ATPase [Candidatus Desulfofervidus auxilii]AMM40766.1 chromosome segregation protein SMC [Candidatus Desulfofervidus auxilii]